MCVNSIMHASYYNALISCLVHKKSPPRALLHTIIINRFLVYSKIIGRAKELTAIAAARRHVRRHRRAAVHLPCRRSRRRCTHCTVINITTIIILLVHIGRVRAFVGAHEPSSALGGALHSAAPGAPAHVHVATEHIMLYLQ